MKRPMWIKNWGPGPQLQLSDQLMVSNNWPSMEVSHLETDLPHPRQAALAKAARQTILSKSCQNWRSVSKRITCCYFRPLNFRVICYMIIEGQFTQWWAKKADAKSIYKFQKQVKHTYGGRRHYGITFVKVGGGVDLERAWGTLWNNGNAQCFDLTGSYTV